jgi:hypothetical protein
MFNLINLRVFIKDSPQQEEKETTRWKDTEFAAMKLPRCLVGGAGESGVGCHRGTDIFKKIQCD